MLGRLNLKSEFLKYVVVLMSGTVTAQLIAYVFAPVITRIYSPEEGAELGLFLRIIGVGAALATARYEFALPIAKTHSHSFRLYRLSFLISSIVSSISVLVLIIPLFTGGDFIQFIFYALVPLGIFLTAMANLGTNWSVRLKSFNIITYSKISNALVGNIAKVGFGVLKMGYIGLIIGTVIGLVISSTWFIRDYLKAGKVYNVRYLSPRNWLLAKQNIDFPTINLPHAIMDLTRDLLIAVILLELFSKEEFGLYDHSYRMMRLPLMFVGFAIGQVFFQRCAEMVNKGEDVSAMIAKSIRTLTILSILPFTFIFFYGEELFGFVFGEEWSGAGRYSEIMAPMFMINFISSPISSMPMVLRKQKQFFVLAIFASLIMLGSIFIPPYFFGASIETMLYIFSLTYSAYLIFVIFRIFRYAKEVAS